MIKSIHIVKEGGAPFFEFPDDTRQSNIVSMFCSALKEFGKVNFNQMPESIQFSDGMQITFKQFKVKNVPCQLFIVHDGESKQAISGVAIKIKWSLEKIQTIENPPGQKECCILNECLKTLVSC